jgi:hypothetical protein
VADAESLGRPGEYQGRPSCDAPGLATQTPGEVTGGIGSDGSIPKQSVSNLLLRIAGAAVGGMALQANHERASMCAGLAHRSSSTRQLRHNAKRLG